jgi:hypothetical protein
VFSGVSSASGKYAEGPGDYGLGVFIAAEFGEVQDKGSGDTTMVYVGAFLEAFLKCPRGLPQLQRIRISVVSVCRLKEFYCITLVPEYVYVHYT